MPRLCKSDQSTCKVLPSIIIYQFQIINWWLTGETSTTLQAHMPGLCRIKFLGFTVCDIICQGEKTQRNLPTSFHNRMRGLNDIVTGVDYK